MFFFQIQRLWRLFLANFLTLGAWRYWKEVHGDDPSAGDPCAFFAFWEGQNQHVHFDRHQTWWIMSPSFLKSLSKSWVACFLPSNLLKKVFRISPMQYYESYDGSLKRCSGSGNSLYKHGDEFGPTELQTRSAITPLKPPSILVEKLETTHLDPCFLHPGQFHTRWHEVSLLGFKDAGAPS